MSTFLYSKPGIGNTPSFQSSGKPWLTTFNISGSQVVELQFPQVTKFICLKNNPHGSSNNHYVKVGFNENGMSGSNYIELHNGECVTLEIKVTSIRFQGAGHDCDVSVFAGLTNIESVELVNNWSGSAGVG